MLEQMEAPGTTYNARETAERLGVHYNTVLRWIEKGELRAEKRGGEWAVPRSELERIGREWESGVEGAQAAANAAAYVAELAIARQLETLATSVRGAGDFAAIYEDLRTLKDADPIVLEERLETLKSRAGELRGALEAFERSFEGERLAGELAGLARRKGREADSRMDALEASNKARRQRLADEHGDD